MLLYKKVLLMTFGTTLVYCRCSRNYCAMMRFDTTFVHDGRGENSETFIMHMLLRALV